jgi:hypothetical protein
MPSPKKKQRMQARDAARAGRSGLAVSTLPPMQHTVARTPPATWPVVESWVSRGWDTEGALAQVAVVREDPESGAVAAATFLVDLGCLGIKNADVKRYTSRAVFRVTVFAVLNELQPMEPIDFNTAAKIVREGLAYAESLGFKPHRDYRQAAMYLAGADPAASDIEVPLGKDGQPLFINGPYDNVDRSIAQLDRVMGRGNYYVDLMAPPL